MLTAFRAAEDVTAGGRYVHGLTHLRFIYLNTEKKRKLGLPAQWMAALRPPQASHSLILIHIETA